MDHQWRYALVKANAQRAAHRVLRARLVAHQVTLQQALGDRAAERLPVWRVIDWLPGWGPQRTSRLLGELGIWPNRPCGELTARQRRQLGDRVR